MNTHDMLVKLYQRIQDPRRWADHEVRNIGKLPNGELACGCVLQHLTDLARRGDPAHVVANLLREAIKTMPRRPGDEDPYYIGMYNDSHPHHEVLTMVHKAMKMAEEERKS